MVNKKSSFDIPVVLFLFKRIDKPLLVLKRISEVRPKRLYILSDGGRNDEEKIQVELCRKEIEQAIDWDCEVVKRYASENVGVYENIAGGAQWVFDREKFAIFLEDDNLPEISFFYFCEELLKRYEDDKRVFWICGTNYLEKYEPADGSSYLFTKNMMPCGWASWSNKFIEFYKNDLTLWEDKYVRELVKSEYSSNKLFFQDSYNLDYELSFFKKFGRYYSWDYQMAFSIRVNGLYGIVPKYNQISNIGVDELSIHGGNNLDDLMSKRFCNLKTYSIDFPLVHPEALLRDCFFEEEITNIIIDPRFFSIRSRVSRKLKNILNIESTESLKKYLKNILLRS